MTQVIHNLLVPKSDEDVFPELALSLFVMIEALYTRLCKAGARDVYFLSREGQPLMRLFEAYQCRNGQTNSPIACHYLEVSRRATFMPSLSDLGMERFDTLFRQYRAISLLEFLSNLGLESHLAEVAAVLGVNETILRERAVDLPSSPHYLALLNNAWFQKLFKTERQAQRDAFISYLTDLSGGTLPSTLHIVDVGWKGTIQDNLHRLLCDKELTPVKGIDGYYLGLVGAGAASTGNRKHGLLFSALKEPSKHIHVFNENRALFEVTLAADHGSVASYVNTEDGHGLPIRSNFEEEEMVKQLVFPLQARMVERFNELLDYFLTRKYDTVRLTRLAAHFHARMVFKPTAQEINWFSTVFHVENFGVFENSRFGATRPATFRERVRFTARLASRRRSMDLGFWPWLSIKRQALPGVAVAYRYFRSRGLA